MPDLDVAPYVSRPPTSFGITNKDSGETYPGSRGQHIFLLVKDQRDGKRFLEDLQDRLWLAGFGWGLVSAAGSYLVRSPIDVAVGSPERLVFEGPPILAKPLVQADRRATVSNTGWSPLDTLDACPLLTAKEAAEVFRLKALEEARLLPERERTRSEWSLPRIKALVASGCASSSAA